MIKAIRGAVQFTKDDKALITERVGFLIKKMISENGINEEQIVSIFFSITKDLKTINPAAALRSGGAFGKTPLFCAQEPDTAGAMPRVVRVLLTCEFDENVKELTHIYLDGAEKLRPDLS